MGRKRAETPDEHPAATSPKEPISKADAVRAALAEGIDTPDEGIAFLQKRFGIEMGKPMWSSYKAQEKARKAKLNGDAPPKLGRPPAVATDAPAPARSIATGGSVSDSLKSVKELVDRLGADEVIKIAEIFRG